MGRVEELADLAAWWASPSPLAMVWGRRRVGKTWLLHEFSKDKRSVFFTATGRSLSAELAALTDQCRRCGLAGDRDLQSRPFASYEDALDHLADQARDVPLLVVVDEFGEAVVSDPSLPGVLRAFLERRGHTSALKICVCGSAVRAMHALAEERQPLYGRFGLMLQVHPFPVWDVATMLPNLTPQDVALVYGLLGGSPMYVSWWNAEETPGHNVRQLFCRPSSRALLEGELVLATEVDDGQLPRRVLEAIAAGRTRFAQIRDWVGAEPGRTLELLAKLRLIERLAPVTDAERNSRKFRYRIADPFLSFYLGTLARYRPDIERGLGEGIAPVLMDSIDDVMGVQFEVMARDWLRTAAARGRFGERIVSVGPWWKDANSPELDVLGLQGRGRVPAFVAEVKWAKTVDGARQLRRLREAVSHVPGADPDAMRYVVVARDQVTGQAPTSVDAVTAHHLVENPK